MIIIIDYGMGNLGSVFKSLKRLNIDAKISSSTKDIEYAKKLILPGVGHFANGIRKLRELNLVELLNRKVIEDKTPILGICLGMQLFASYSEEGCVDGLNWLNANVVKFNIKNKIKFKVPHMGWNSVEQKKKSILLKNIPSNSLFYFVHSYHLVCNIESDILTSTNYEYEFTSSVQRNNIYGTQFHPEKSHDWGLQILKNFALSV